MGEPGLDVRSTQDNVRLSAKLLRLLLDRTGSTKQALAAYYQGIGAVLQRGVSTGGARYAASSPLARPGSLAAALRVTAVTRPSGGVLPASRTLPGPRRRPPATRGRPWQTTNRLQSNRTTSATTSKRSPRIWPKSPSRTSSTRKASSIPTSTSDAALETDDVVEDEEEEEEEAPRRPVTAEDEEDDEDIVDPDDVEADLDTILKDRLVAAEDTPDEDEEEAEPEERGEAGDRLQPKRADEQLCPSCFLLVRRTAPSCLIGDEDCPLFS